MIIPLIDYSITVYGFSYKSHYQRIEKLLNRAARVITSSGSEYSILFQELNWKTFLCRRNYFCSIFIYKCLHKLSAKKCQNIFKYKESVLKTRAISNWELVLPNYKFTTFMNSIFYTGIQIYKKLDINIRKKQRFNNFVNALKKDFN